MSVFALIKVLGLNGENSLHVNLARGVFALGHVIFTIMFIKSLNGIDAQILTNDQKLALRASIKKMYSNIGIRAIIISLVHYKTKMLPPLFMSCVMGLFTIAESNETHGLNHKKKTN